MPSTPIETIDTLIDARRNHDFETAFACYAEDAVVLLEKGRSGAGETVLRAFIEGASALSISFEDHEIVEYGDFALHTSRYVLDMGDQGKVPGRTADVLVRGGDGRWRIAIDNPWAG